MPTSEENAAIQELSEQILDLAPETAKRWSETDSGSTVMVYIATLTYKKRNLLRALFGLEPVVHYSPEFWVWQLRANIEPSRRFFLHVDGKFSYWEQPGVFDQVSQEYLKTLSSENLEGLKKALESPRPPYRAPSGLYAEA